MNALLIAAVLLAPPAPTPPKAQLEPSMQAALSAVVVLQPLVASPVAFRDPANAAQVRASLDVLTPLEHFFTKPAGPTPPAAGIATLFTRELEKSRKDFDAGRTEDARMRLRSITALCFGCHQREPAAQDPKTAAPLMDTLKLTPLERASVYASTRQLDRALAEWDRIFATTPSNDVEAFEQTEAVRFALSVAVQGKDDPAIAIALLEKNKDRKELPRFTTVQMAQWLVEAKAWQAERFDAAKQKPAALVARAKALMANSRIEKGPTADDARLVSHLRAAGYLQEALRREPAAPFRGEALYLLGVVSAAVADPTLWRLEWITLESCVRENPKSALAKKCADRLTERTYFSYTGRGGLDLPAGVAADLGVLHGIAR
jgi:tetratricopeptide (TPR) repeat protein